MREALYKKFNVKTRKGRGGYYPFIEWQDVADRMNEIFGVHWSSNVESEEIIGNNVIIRVRVTIYDTEKNLSFWHDGYGGAPNDERNEAGNPFKAAYSKALKDACKKWGIGLYVDEDGDEDSQSNNTPNINQGFETGVMPPNNNTLPKVNVDMETGRGTIPNVGTGPNMTGTGINPSMNMPSSTSIQMPGSTVTPNNSIGGFSSVVTDTSTNVSTIPSSIESTVVHSSNEPTPPVVDQSFIGKKVNQSVPSNNSMGGMSLPPSIGMGNTPIQSNISIPTAPPVSVNNTPKLSKDNIINMGEDMLSDVQKVALNSMLKKLEQLGVTYEALVTETFAAAGVNKSVPELDKLTYKEAVLIIKSGNDKYRNKQ